MRIYLIGLPGVGKSTLGKRLAKRLRYFFIDLDAYIEMREGVRIPQLFEMGEGHFRKIETNTLYALPKGRRMVIATGGGIVLKKENVDYMKRTGFVIYLDRPVDAILKHLHVDKRPLLRDDPQKLYTLQKQREVLYEGAAHLKVKMTDLHKAVLEITKEIETYENSRDQWT